jgi:hypothetical protein
VEIVAPIAWIGEFSMSFQSLNPQTRDAIKRTNISLEKLAANIDWAKKRNILTASEMIYGFPYETPSTFFDGVETLINAGMNKVVIYPLQLFSGIDLDSKEARQKYGFKTMFRLADAGYGVYQDGRIVATETEEVVVGTNWSNFQDYLTVRRYAFFLMALYGREYLLELSRLCDEAGIHAVSVVRHLTSADYANQPTLNSIMSEYNCAARGELYESRAAVNAAIAPRLLNGEDVSGVKLNLVYLAKIFVSRNAIAELLGVVQLHFDRVLLGHPYREVINTYIREILPNRIVELKSSRPASTSFLSRFDYHRWLSNDYGDLTELVLSDPQQYEGIVETPLIENLVGFDPERASNLQGIYDKTKNRHLLKTILAA